MAQATIAPTPKYLKVKRKLTQMIRSGRWPSGGMFPSEAQLVAQFKISRPTLIRSLQELVREGYLYRKQGQGTFVADYANRSQEYKTLPLIIAQDLWLRNGDDRHILEQILQGIESSLLPAGFKLQVIPVPPACDGMMDHVIKQFSDLATQAALVYPHEIPGGLQSLAQLHCERLYVIGEPSNDYDCFYIDEEQAGYTATRYLLDCGRERIALLNGNSSYWGVAARQQGYERALRDAGFEPDPMLMLSGRNVLDSEAGRNMIRQLLASGVSFDGVFGASDRKAMGAMAALIESGRRIPQDIGVVSMDDTLAARGEPPLSAVHLPFFKMGQIASARIIQAPEATAASTKTMTRLTVTLHDRQSGGKA